LPFNPTSSTYAPIPWIYDPTDPEPDPNKRRRIYFTQSEVAGRRLDVLRDLQRLEMPDRWNDTRYPPLTFAWTAGQPWGRVPSVTARFQARYNQARALLLSKGKSATEADDILARYASAKLLYMIVMTHDPEAAEHFRSDEIARPTEDGLPVFVDAWGNPIKFLRWAPGFDQSGFQPTVSPIDDATARANAASEIPDPWNQKKTYRHGVLLAPATTDLGWLLVPLIYSAGPDGIYDVVVDTPETPYRYAGDPFACLTGSPARAMGTGLDSENTSETAGVKVPANVSIDHFDNVTNHQNAVR
jgi:hypothetical protein